MLLTVSLSEQTYQANLNQPIDISIPLQHGLENPNAFWATPVTIEPVVAGDFVGDTQQGGVVNFKNVQLNPHGNGTHTECVGHISKEFVSLNQSLKQFFFTSELYSVYPQQMPNGDRVILKEQLKNLQYLGQVQALVIRTLPNHQDKLTRNYSGTNPPYLHHEAVSFLVENGIQHLVIDLPSVDREQDEGKLLAHKAFWQYAPQEGLTEHTRTKCTITEMVFIPDSVKDGLFALNLQITSLELDASPSKPVFYRLLRR